MARLNRGEAPEGIRFHQSLPRSIPPGFHIPDISKDLLEYLDVVFQDRLDPSWRDIGDVREAIGSRRVVDHLRQLFNDQEQQNVSGR